MITFSILLILTTVLWIILWAADNYPVFATIPHHAAVQLTTANTNMDGTGTPVDLLTGAGNGTRVTGILFGGVGTMAAGLIRLFYYDGSNYRYMGIDIVVAATTPSATVAGWSKWYKFDNPLIIPLNKKLAAVTTITQTINAIPQSADISTAA